MAFAFIITMPCFCFGDHQNRAVREIISSYRDRSPCIGAKWEIHLETGPLVPLIFHMRVKGKNKNEIMKSPCGSLYKTQGCLATFSETRAMLELVNMEQKKIQMIIPQALILKLGEQFVNYTAVFHNVWVPLHLWHSK